MRFYVAKQLAQDTVADVSLGIEATTETVMVTAEVSLVDKESATIASGLSNEQIKALPVAQEYRDLQKLIPAVQYTAASATTGTGAETSIAPARVRANAPPL